ncbi:LEAF RUST 10 DISEASE-RESISTANCE LOCUS RECEPTOR-LIKE PROTEIN KINASE-like 1.2 [Syzygium oleosum]|uniref:LEAF RUST 10 DISEASE-RESISTANCE LOCUS RECEPTOR-LIKE PROTEIN KINASE-like 1.2 n=1 Tax=Syzygium oleosum TaxID=219896 RepID=UPI0011D25AD4|nr:LEAF RUST 10 DISEASE-RESISTANCE LOCUS RECEPTOR-LIKE PROTEIN KINASE-like 1.2 [Syzygium oleosum]
MKQLNPSLTKLIIPFFTISALFLIPSTSAQTCRTACGNQPIRYPFGSGPGCGDPRFQGRITCDEAQQMLTLTTHTGCYPITAIDYAAQVIYISDPTMSTCVCSQSSRGFGLDWDAPFSIHENTIFALLDCSTSASPIYSPAAPGNSSFSSSPLCDAAGTSICSFLYSCHAISMMNQPISTCCVYTPVDLGPAYEMDLGKLKCSSYSGFYSFDGQEVDPDRWKYGVALKYKFNVYNEYPSSCAKCERSGGACGYGGAYGTFVCSCPDGGLNTTSDCFFGASWSETSGHIPAPHTGTWASLRSVVSILSLVMIRAP